MALKRAGHDRSPGYRNDKTAAGKTLNQAPIEAIFQLAMHRSMHDGRVLLCIKGGNTLRRDLQTNIQG